MKQLLYTLLAALLVSGCTKKEDTFYTAHYPIVELEALINLAAENEAMEAEVEAWVLEHAPVQVGGSYRLDFNRFDGGTLTVKPTEKAEAIVGDFTKIPAATEMTFTYGEQSYVVRTSIYMGEDKVTYQSFLIDLTAAAREALQNEAIEQVLRLEYTLHPQQQR